MYYIKKEVSFIKSGLHIWTIRNLIFALLYYKEYCNCVILWTFNYYAVFLFNCFLLLPLICYTWGNPVLCKNLSCFFLFIYLYLFFYYYFFFFFFFLGGGGGGGVISCYFCITVKIQYK